MANSARYRWALLAIFVVALAIRLWGCDFGFPYFHHPDESKLVQPALELINFNRLNLHPGHFDYPPLYIYLLALLTGLYALFLIAAGYVSGVRAVAAFLYCNTAHIHLLGRLLNALLGAFATLLLYKTVRRLFDSRAGIIAAIFLAVAYSHVVHCHYAVTDVLASLLVLVPLYFASQILDEKRWAPYIYAAVAAGAAAAAKYPAGLSILFPITAHLIYAIRARCGWRRITLSPRLWAILPLSAATFFAVTPYVLLDWPLFVWDTLRVKFVMGNPETKMLLGARHFFDYLTAQQPALGIGFPMAVLAIAGLGLIYWRWRAKAVLLYSFPVIYYIILGRNSIHIDRHLVLMIPLLCAAAATSLVAAGDLLFSQKRSRVAVGLVVAAIAIHALAMDIQWDRAASAEAPRNQAAAWIDSNIPPQATILLAQGPAGWPYPYIDPKNYHIIHMDMPRRCLYFERLSFLARLAESPLLATFAGRVAARGLAVDAKRPELGYIAPLHPSVLAAQQPPLDSSQIRDHIDPDELRSLEDIPSLSHYLDMRPAYVIFSDKLYRRVMT